MFGKTIAIGHAVLIIFLSSAALPGQQKPVAPGFSAAALELPVTMGQNVVAGKTTVGTRIQAKLAVATLVNGVVIPEHAVLSGEVTESVAKSANDPSRLAIRMDSAQWKNGSAPLKVYLTAWFYPLALLNQNISNQREDAADSGRTSPNMGTYPGQTDAASLGRSPGRDSDRDTGLAPPLPSSATTKHRVLMKNIESSRDGGGAIILTSQRSNIKLDKATTYVLATSDLLTMK